MSDSMTVSVDRKIVEDVVRSKIATEVALSMSTVKDELIERLVKSIAHQKVDSDGRPSNSDYHSQPLLQYLVQKQIKELAQEAMKQFVAENKATLDKKIRDAMKKNQDKFVQAFMQSLEKQISDKWSVTMEVLVKS